MTSAEAKTLRPGLLVALHVGKVGNVAYTKLTIEAEHEENGEQVAEWNTRRRIADPYENEVATKLVSQIGWLVRSVCTRSAKWLLCPLDREPELLAAVEKGHEIADDFNSKAGLTRIEFSVVTGRVAADEVEAMRAVAMEVRTLMDDMEQGIRAQDPDAIRKAANKTTTIGQMLSDSAKGRMEVAVEASRKTANKLAKLIRAGEAAALEVDRVAIAKISMARTSFLDFDAPTAEVAAPAIAGLGLDFEPTESVAAPAVAAPVMDFEVA